LFFCFFVFCFLFCPFLHALKTGESFEIFVQNKILKIKQLTEVQKGNCQFLIYYRVPGTEKSFTGCVQPHNPQPQGILSLSHLYNPSVANDFYLLSSILFFPSEMEEKPSKKMKLPLQPPLRSNIPSLPQTIHNIERLKSHIQNIKQLE
jgi:hypothetical protein